MRFDERARDPIAFSDLRVAPRPETPYAEMDPAERARAEAETRRVVFDMLRRPGRDSFPRVPVVLGGRPVNRAAVVCAWQRVRQRRLGMLGRDRDAIDWIGMFAEELPEAMRLCPHDVGAALGHPQPPGDFEVLRGLAAPLVLPE